MPGSTRRTFLASMTAAGAAAPLLAGTRRAGHRVPPQKILVLGGTGFLGPHFVRAALANGHTVTLFNRGKSDPVCSPTSSSCAAIAATRVCRATSELGMAGRQATRSHRAPAFCSVSAHFGQEVPSFLSAPT